MGVVRSDNTEQIKYRKGKLIGDCPTPSAKSLAIQETMMISIQEKLSNVIKSDSQIAIHVIVWVTNASSIISSIVEDIRILISIIRNLNLSICNSNVNKLADSIAKKAHQCNYQTVFLY